MQGFAVVGGSKRGWAGGGEPPPGGSAYGHSHARVNHVRGRRRRDGPRKGEKVGERIVALLSTNRWQTCVHQRAAYRPPLTCQPPPGHIVKYGSRRCTTPHLGGTPHPATSPSALLRIRSNSASVPFFPLRPAPSSSEEAAAFLWVSRRGKRAATCNFESSIIASVFLNPRDR